MTGLNLQALAAARILQRSLCNLSCPCHDISPTPTASSLLSSTCSDGGRCEPLIDTAEEQPLAAVRK